MKTPSPLSAPCNWRDAAARPAAYPRMFPANMTRSFTTSFTNHIPFLQFDQQIGFYQRHELTPQKSGNIFKRV
jgi:hypothetical protein